VRVAVAALLGLALALPAGASPILDVEAAPTSGFFNVDNDASALQQFSVGQSGAIVRIDVFARSDFGTCAGSGCLLALGTATANLSLAGVAQAAGSIFDDWIEFAFSAPRAVVAGDVLFFDVEHDDFIVFGAGTYTPGVEWACGLDGCSHPLNPDPSDHSSDVPNTTVIALSESYAFRVWIEPAAVPEPSGLALGASAFAAAAGARRRAWHAWAWPKRATARTQRGR
jgi:hypothetical protein